MTDKLILTGAFVLGAYVIYELVSDKSNKEYFSAYPKIDVSLQDNKIMLEYRLPISFTGNQRAIAAKCGQMRSPPCKGWTMDPGTGDGILYLGY